MPSKITEAGSSRQDQVCGGRAVRAACSNRATPPVLSTEEATEAITDFGSRLRLRLITVPLL